MKKIITTFIFCFLFGECFSQVGEWTWIHGDTTTAYNVIYGTQGIPNPANSPSGAYEGCEWTDNQGNFWFFGSSTYAWDNNLWKYDPLTNEWTWMKGPGIPNDTGNYGIMGVSSPTNNPPARGFGIATWSDTTGNLWLYGGENNTSQFNAFQDLWKYDISTNEWTWMKGSNVSNQIPVYGTQGIPSPLNTPGSRCEAACTWIDNLNNLWLFGGADWGGNAFNDLWKYNISTNEWTWMKGLNYPGGTGTYGTLGIPSLLNVPTPRWCYSRWKDNNGNLWLFGGNQAHYSTGYKFKNDLWKYFISTNEWAWMKGDSAVFDTGSFGIKCNALLTNNPTCRFENRACWTDLNGNFWMFGGLYWAPPTYISSMTNDLWQYNVVNNEWIWVWGDSVPNQHGVFGIMGISSPTNKPISRCGAVSWYDITTNSAYIFGGYEYRIPGDAEIRNDLWKYVIDPNCPIGTGLQENNFTNELLVFPNPSNSSINISFQSSTKQNIEYRLYNTLGETVYFSKEKSPVGKIEKEINVKNISKGIYLLQVKIMSGILTKKIIVKPTT